jgi:hypothetical protein
MEAQAFPPTPSLCLFCSKRNIKSKVAEMRKIPWWKLQIWLEQPIQYNNISTGHSCFWAMPDPCQYVFYHSLLLNVCDLKAAVIFLFKPTGWGGKAAWAFFYCEYSKVLSLFSYFCADINKAFWSTLTYTFSLLYCSYCIQDIGKKM